MDYVDELECQAIEFYYAAADCRNRELAAGLYGLAEFLLLMADRQRERLTKLQSPRPDASRADL